MVTHRQGPLLVVGGPGTGKTTTLVEAVAARVAEGVDPAHILVLTFGRKAPPRCATGSRRGSGAAGPAAQQSASPCPSRWCAPFPAYAFGLLRRAAAERGEPSPRLLTGPEQDLIIRELLDVVGEEPATTRSLAGGPAARAADPGVRGSSCATC